MTKHRCAKNGCITCPYDTGVTSVVPLVRVCEHKSSSISFLTLHKVPTSRSHYIATGVQEVPTVCDNAWHV